MENKRVVPVWVTVVLAVLVVAVAVNNYFAIANNDSGNAVETLTNVFTFLSYLTALLYCSSSYSKESAPLYIMFTGSNAITCYMCLAVSLRGNAATPTSVTLGIAQALMFAIFCIFCIAKNLGKRKSLSMAALLVACSIVCLVMMLPMETTTLLNTIGGVLLMVVFFLMTFAKYKDKAARGTN